MGLYLNEEQCKAASMVFEIASQQDDPQEGLSCLQGWNPIKIHSALKGSTERCTSVTRTAEFKPNIEHYLC